MTSRISIIVAMDDRRGIGKGNGLLFKIPEDFKRMQTITTGHPIIMGRKTYESIGRILPNRTNIIITRDPSYQVPGGAVCSSLEEAITLAQAQTGAEEIFIFGGGEIFKEALEKNLVNRLYITLVKGDYGADTFFPVYTTFTRVLEKVERQLDGYHYTFLTLDK